MSEHSIPTQSEKTSAIVNAINNDERRELRLRMRRARNKLSPTRQSIASYKLAQKVIACGLLKQCNSVAFYLPSDGEISALPIIKYCRRLGIKCYLPRIEKNQAMHFRLFNTHKGLQKNKYGILEPKLHCRKIPAEKLEVVFTPLVAFDKNLNRMGMGGGYYDRAFAYKRLAKKLKPMLIGLAHSIQKTSAIQIEIWDVPLDYLISDSELLKRPH